MVPVGDSDHLGVSVSKVTRVETIRPQCLRLRSYAHTDLEALLYDIHLGAVNDLVVGLDYLDEVVEVFEREIKYYLNKHAPIKTIPVKNKCKPFISTATKDLIHLKKQAWQAYRATNDPEAHKKYWALIKEVKQAVAQDRLGWMSNDLGPMSSTKSAWSKARVLLGQDKSPCPRMIKTGPDKYVSNPLKMAELFATHYSTKTANLGARRCTQPTRDPVTRLRDWLSTRDTPPPAMILMVTAYYILLVCHSPRGCLLHLGRNKSSIQTSRRRIESSLTTTTLYLDRFNWVSSLRP